MLNNVVAVGERLLCAGQIFGGRGLFTRIWKYSLRRVLFPICVLGPFAYFFPKIALFYTAVGVSLDPIDQACFLNSSTRTRVFSL